MSPVDFELVNETLIAHLREDIDAANVGSIFEELIGSLGPGSYSLIVDLSAISYADSAGIDMLLRLNERLQHRRAKLILMIPTASQLTRLAQIVGLPQVVEIHPTLASAQAAADKLPQSATPSPPDGTRRETAGS